MAADALAPCAAWSSAVMVLTVLHTGLTLDLHPANERRRYIVTPSLIGWAQT